MVLNQEERDREQQKVKESFVAYGGPTSSPTSPTFQREVRPKEFSPAHREFDALIKQLSDRIVGLQLRPGDAQKLGELLEELKKKSGHPYE